MASIGRQLVCAAHRSSCTLHCRTDFLINQSRSLSLTQMNARVKRWAKSKFIGFKVDPREPITDLVSHPRVYDGPDPGPVFMDHHVQSILTTLTGCDHDKVFHHRKIKFTSAPSYVFYTDKQLEKANKVAAHRANWLLRMPPVMAMGDSSTVVICKDPALEGFNAEKIIFIDISPGIPDRKRLIVVREPDGTLRHASPDERHRMNQIYNPRKGRELTMPELFSARRLKDVLSREAYEFVLDKACIQMEPDEPVFQATAATTYDAIDQRRHCDVLLSTRYYGTMLFYLVWHARADGIIEDMMNKERMNEAGEVIRLHMLIHPGSKTALAAGTVEDPLELVKKYVAEESKDRASLELAIKRFEELQRNKRAFEAKARAAHGDHSVV